MSSKVLNMLPDSPKENCYGLTINQWAAAAGIPREKIGPELAQAWKDGEDPTEYRAKLSKNNNSLDSHRSLTSTSDEDWIYNKDNIYV